jgi:tRNA(Glu) U13 pseudouridine synthase TruD
MAKNNEEAEIRKDLLKAMDSYKALDWSEDSCRRTDIRNNLLDAYRAYIFDDFASARIRIDWVFDSLPDEE